MGENVQVNESCGTHSESQLVVDKRAQKPSVGGRLFEYDLLRTIACFFVVAVHAMLIPRTWDSAYVGVWYVSLTFAVLSALFYACNGAFFMMSGRFNIKAPRSLKNFYVKKLSALLVSLIIAMVIHTMFDIVYGGGPIRDISSLWFIKTVILNIVYNYSGIEYWFMYVLLGYILVVPFLYQAFTTMSRSYQYAFVGLGLAFQTGMTLTYYLGYSFPVSVVFANFIFVFCLGSIIEPLITQRWLRHVIVIVGLFVAPLVNGYMAWIGYRSYSYEASPLMIATVVGLLIVCQWAAHLRWSSVLRRAISAIARYSYGIYLVQMMVVNALNLWVFSHVSVSGWLILPAYAGATLVAFGISLLLSLVLTRISAPITRAIQRRWA